MLVTPGLLSTSRWLLRERAKPAMKTGDKRGTQPPATPRTALQKKSQFVINARENTCFSDIVGILENTLVAEEGLEPPTRGLCDSVQSLHGPAADLR